MKPEQFLNITLVQPKVYWENKKQNFLHLESLLENAIDSDLIILPEMFSTGFSMNPASLAEPMEGDSMKWMHEQATKHNAVVTGSLIIQEQDKFYNRLVWMHPKGEYECYDKRHLFSFAEEEKSYTAGKRRLIVSLKGWRICPLICYDLRFPVWIRNQELETKSSEMVYDLLLFVANWPEARTSAWTNLLEARAHENQCYVAGVNRVGEDGNGIMHSGHSAVFSPKGEKLSNITPYQEQVSRITLDYEDLKGYRSKFTAWKDSDNFSLII